MHSSKLKQGKEVVVRCELQATNHRVSQKAMDSLAKSSCLPKMSVMAFIIVFQAVILISNTNGDSLHSQLLASNSPTSVNHGKDYCAMYDICGKREDGKVLNCPYSVPAVQVIFLDSLMVVFHDTLTVAQ